MWTRKPINCESPTPCLSASINLPAEPVKQYTYINWDRWGYVFKSDCRKPQRTLLGLSVDERTGYIAAQIRHLQQWRGVCIRDDVKYLSVGSNFCRTDGSFACSLVSGYAECKGCRASESLRRLTALITFKLDVAYRVDLLFCALSILDKLVELGWADEYDQGCSAELQ